MQGPSRPLKAALLFAAFTVVFIVAATASRRPDLSQVSVAFLSGSEDGNYHAIVAKAAAEAQRRHGRIDNLTTDAGAYGPGNELSLSGRTHRGVVELVQEISRKTWRVINPGT